MTPAPLTYMSINYVECDIPEGQTLVEWRRELNAARRAAQPRPAPSAPVLPALDSEVVGMNAHELRMQLGRLMAERLDATEAGLGANAMYMSELDEDLVAARAAYVGMAVTEIASLRGQLWGAQAG